MTNEEKKCRQCGLEMTVAGFSPTAFGLTRTPYKCNSCIMKDWEKEQEEEDDDD